MYFFIDPLPFKLYTVVTMKKRISSYALPILVLLIVWICQLLYGAALLFSKPLVTVIMPTYNRADLLPRAIESVLKQTFRDFELIIVDDGSTDGSVDLIRSYMEKDKRIFLIVNNRNKGISYSRNRAYNAARGKYIMPMDSDDQILPNKLLVQTTFLENHPDIDLVGSYARPFHNLNTLFWTDTGSKTVDLLFANPFGHIETLMRKSFLDKHKIRYDESFIAAVDYDLYAQMLMKGARFATIPQTLSHVRKHRTNPKKYYQEQSRNHRKVQEKLFRFFDVPYTPNDNVCLILKHLQLRPPRAQGLPSDQIQKKYNRLCFRGNDCHSPQAQDYILKQNNKNTVVRLMPDKTICTLEKSKGQVISHTGNKLVIVWDDRQPHETYTCSRNICVSDSK